MILIKGKKLFLIKLRVIARTDSISYMKTRKDPRHLQRIRIIQELFAWDFNPSTSSGLNEQTTKKIIKNLKKIDPLIEQSAPEWPIAKINKIDLAILRLAVYELTINVKAPPKVIVDEAVELGKSYGSDTSSSFINGALGKLITDQKIQT